MDDGAELVGRLKKLSELHAAGALTDEEFAVAKASVLGGSSAGDDPAAQLPALERGFITGGASIPTSPVEVQPGSLDTSPEASERSAPNVTVDRTATALPTSIPSAAPSFDRPSLSVPPPPALTPSRRRRHPRALLAAGAVVLAIVALAIFAVAVRQGTGSTAVSGASGGVPTSASQFSPRVITRVPVGNFAQHLVMSPDGQRAYAVGSDDVAVIDTATDTVADTISLGASPEDIAFTPDGRYGYFTVWSGHVSVLGTTGDVVSAVNIGERLGSIVVTPDGSRALVLDVGLMGYGDNAEPGTMSVIETAINEVVASVIVGKSPSGIVVTPDGDRAYVANYSSGTVSVIDTGTNSVTRTITTGDKPSDVAITPDGSSVYVTHSDSGSISVIDAASDTVSRTISSSGRSPTGLAIAPDGRQAYVSDGDLGLLVVDLDANSVVATVGLPDIAAAVVVTPNGRRAYVATIDGSDGGDPGTVHVVDITR